MAVNNLKPINNAYPNSFIFYPRKKRVAKKMDLGHVNTTLVIHYGNINTCSPKYKYDVKGLNNYNKYNDKKFKYIFYVYNYFFFFFKKATFYIKKIYKKLELNCR